MKINIKKTNSISLATKVALVFVSVVLAVYVPIQIMNKIAHAECSSISECDAEISARQRDIAKYQVASDKLNSQATTLKIALEQLANQKASIQAAIDISQAKYNKLVKQIADTEKQIKDNKDALGTTIASMYVDGNVTPIEMLASSKNIGDYLDKQEYQSSIRNQLTSTISTIKELKAKLDKQKIDVGKVLKDQKSQKATLIAKESEQQNLLDMTKGQEASYQQLISDNQAKIADARATQAAISSRINNTGGYVLIDAGSLVDYPWNASNCPMWGYLSTGGSDGDGHDGGADGIGSDGYGCRQCASYVAWRFAKETGVYPYWGDAVDFTAGATSLGYKEGGPQAGSIAVMDPAKAGQYHGHVAWVESDPYTNSRGETVIQVSQYNFDFGQGYGMYSLMELSVYAFDHYIHIK